MKSESNISAKEANQRLDKFLSQKFSQYSRAYLKEQIKAGVVLVDDKIVKPSYVLREGDLVAFAPEFTAPNEQKILPNPEIKLDIIYEDGDALVINKPAGLSVHPRQDKNGRPLAGEVNNTLISGLLARYPAIATIGDSPALRPGLVHRLDKDTSGVMIVAKNQTSFDWLKKQFQERKVAKKYLALVVGRPKEKQGVMKNLLMRSASDPTKQKVLSYKSPLPSDEGRAGWGDEKISNTTPSQSPPQLRWRRISEAITQYKIFKEFKNFTLIEARPKTGRLHQIRVQFAALGLPVAGDAKYGSRQRPCPPGLARQFLHAQKLKITLPDGSKKAFSSPLPPDLTKVLKGLARK